MKRSLSFSRAFREKGKSEEKNVDASNEALLEKSDDGKTLLWDWRWRLLGGWRKMWDTVRSSAAWLRSHDCRASGRISDDDDDDDLETVSQGRESGRRLIRSLSFPAKINEEEIRRDSDLTRPVTRASGQERVDNVNGEYRKGDPNRARAVPTPRSPAFKARAPSTRRR